MWVKHLIGSLLNLLFSIGYSRNIHSRAGGQTEYAMDLIHCWLVMTCSRTGRRPLFDFSAVVAISRAFIHSEAFQSITRLPTIYRIPLK